MGIHNQFIRYAMIGIGSNLVLYIAYLLMTSLGVGHKTAMTIIYGVGILQTFLLNRYWTFNHQGQIHTALIRYVTIYLIGYIVSFSGLYIFVDMLGFSHQLIQGLMIVLVAILLFTLQRVWVFNQSLDRSWQIRKHGAP
ncbi:MAG: GtrA family protein [Candidatus Thiodiazotropha sp. (ex Lucinoma borealis)]|nr:GtrA family protein [Candidatus Thiodiazotropha sp. (ex Lucinoma borealis)]